MSTMNELREVRTNGLVMHSEARYYDLLAWLLTLGRERAFRERLVELARLLPGEAVLDFCCGTGTLAIAAKRRVGAAGTVHGVDASPEMIDRAMRKARKAGVDVAFRTGVVEALPFPDASFDAVLSTLMLHHLPRPVREQCVREVRRVLKPGGRVLAVDFATPARERQGILARLHRHGHMALREMVALLNDAGLPAVDSGSVGVSDLQFVLAVQSDGAGERECSEVPTRALPPLPVSRWTLAGLAVIVLGAHAVVIGRVSSRVALSTVALAGVVGLLALMHSGFPGAIHALLRRRRSRRPS